MCAYTTLPLANPSACNDLLSSAAGISKLLKCSVNGRDASTAPILLRNSPKLLCGGSCMLLFVTNCLRWSACSPAGPPTIRMTQTSSSSSCVAACLSNPTIPASLAGLGPRPDAGLRCCSRPPRSSPAHSPAGAGAVLCRCCCGRTPRRRPAHSPGGGPWRCCGATGGGGIPRVAGEGGRGPAPARRGSPEGAPVPAVAVHVSVSVPSSRIQILIRAEDALWSSIQASQSPFAWYSMVLPLAITSPGSASPST